MVTGLGDLFGAAHSECADQAARAPDTNLRRPEIAKLAGVRSVQQHVLGRHVPL